MEKKGNFIPCPLRNFYFLPEKQLFDFLRQNKFLLIKKSGQNKFNEINFRNSVSPSKFCGKRISSHSKIRIFQAGLLMKLFDSK